MSEFALAPVPAGASTAAELAARIPIPTRLPPRYDGQPLQHFSNSSYTLFLACPELWRRKYLRGDRPPKTAVMVIGSRVDEAITGYFQQQLEYGQPPTLEDTLDRYESTWAERLDEDRERTPVTFGELDEPTARAIGIEAIKVTFDQLIPQLGTPVAIQRRLEWPLAPGLE